MNYLGQLTAKSSVVSIAARFFDQNFFDTKLFFMKNESYQSKLLDYILF